MVPCQRNFWRRKLDFDSNICRLVGSGIEAEGVPVSVLVLPASWRMLRALDITPALLPALGHRNVALC